MRWIGIRKEVTSRWERRVPLIPSHLARLQEQHNCRFVVQPQSNRAYSDAEFNYVKAELSEKLDDCSIILGVKEVPPHEIQPETIYLFFSHTIKGQSFNMPMLKKLMDLNCTLIDYECITDEENRRLVYFGRHAGLAGMLDTLAVLGQRLKTRDVETPFAELELGCNYNGLQQAQAALKNVGDAIRTDGLPEKLAPFIIGLAGYGNVSQGAQEMLALLPITWIPPEDLASLTDNRHQLYGCIFDERHMVEPIGEPHSDFPKHYFQNPTFYRSIFERYLPYLSVLINGIYWDSRYPRLVTKKWAREMNGGRLEVVGDISCDIDGAVEFTAQTTDPEQPAFVYDHTNDNITFEIDQDGIAVMAYDHLPSQFPREASEFFSSILYPFLPPIIKADWRQPLESLALPESLEKAVILHQGKLTHAYTYLNAFLEE